MGGCSLEAPHKIMLFLWSDKSYTELTHIMKCYTPQTFFKKTDTITNYFLGLDMCNVELRKK